MNTQHLIYALGITLGLSSVPSTVLAQTQDPQSQDPSKQTTTIQPQDVDLEQKLRSLLDEEGEPLFPDYAFDRFRSDDVDLSYALQIADLKYTNGKRLVEDFVPYITIADLYKNEVPIEDIEELVRMTDKEGFGFTLLGIASFYEAGGTLDSARKIHSVVDNEGNPIFRSHEFDGYLENGGTIEFAEALSKITKKDGKPVFDSGNLMSSFLDAGGTIEFARELASLTDEQGNPSLDQRDMYHIQREGISLDRVREVHAARDAYDGSMFDGHTIYRFAQLGLDRNEVNFRDTDRPNAIVIYPTNDWNGAFENEPARAFFHSIKDEYDVFVRIADTEEDVYRAISRVPDTELLILGGHGSEKTLSLGETDLGIREAEKKDERYTLDLSDQELGTYLSRLDPQAVIFLDSCSNAKGDNGDNIADFIANMAGGRTVFAATEPFGAPNVTINQMHPFDITIESGYPDSGRDITYRTPKK